MSQQTIDPIPADPDVQDVRISDLSRIALSYEDPDTGRMAVKMCSIRRTNVDQVLKLMSDLRVM